MPVLLLQCVVEGPIRAVQVQEKGAWAESLWPGTSQAISCHVIGWIGLVEKTPGTFLWMKMEYHRTSEKTWVMNSGKSKMEAIHSRLAILVFRLENIAKHS